MATRGGCAQTATLAVTVGLLVGLNTGNAEESRRSK